MMAVLLVMLLLTAVTEAEFAEDNANPESHGSVADRLTKLEQLFQHQNQRLHQLDVENQRLVDSEAILLAENHDLKASLSSVKQDLASRFFMLEKENHELKQGVAFLTTEKEKLEDSVRELSEKLKSVEKTVTAVKSQKASKPAEEKTVDVSLKRHDLAARAATIETLEPVVNQLTQKLTEVSAEVNANQNDIQALKAANTQQETAIQDASSSVYVRWGSSTCPNSASLVYSGIIGGDHRGYTGAATNFLCLTLSPTVGDHPFPTYWAHVYGTEYATYDSHMDRDAVCAVCRSQRATAIMVPGTDVCMSGWTLEYSGFLMAGQYSDNAGTEYVCVDSDLESRPGGEDSNAYVKLLYYTLTSCGGSLPCPPYTANKFVNCAVCSK
nr:hypothetical protein BaRGS_010471 [Batillaria attramentaria]